MAGLPKKTIEELVAEVGRYPIEAYQFLRDGLTFTVNKVHGNETPMQQRIHKLMQDEEMDLNILEQKYQAGELPQSVARYLDERGGVASVNRHVSGQDLCWGMRDFALEKWGLMASTVLDGWNITSTDDFGRIVFALVENGFLQKQPNDKADDFADVYDFETAFDHTFEIGGNDD